MKKGKIVVLLVLLLGITAFVAVRGIIPQRQEAEAIMDREQKLTPIEESIMEYYGNTSEPVLIYEQVPFEDGTLVLAEELMDGEHYPDLHFVDAEGKVTHITRGSYCWSLNYTQFKEHYIYFGLAGVEASRYHKAPITIKSVEASFEGRTESVVPRQNILSHINPIKGDSRMYKFCQGYIMPVKGREMPWNITAVFQNGEKLSLSEKVIESSLDHMPDYLKSGNKEIYNSFAFSYSPMLTPLEWDKGYEDGEICLEGKTDNNGNRNVLNLTPAGHMSLVHSFVVPQDIKPFYLSDNYPRLASFKPGENVAVKFPEERKLMDCRILKLTREKVEKELGQDRFMDIGGTKEGRLLLPKDKGYYLFLLRTISDKDMEIQTYIGMLSIE